MSRNPTAESVYRRLKHAQEETQVVLQTADKPTIVEMDEVIAPGSAWEGRRIIDRYLDQGIWKTTGPGFQRLQEWVELNWDPARERQTPQGTVGARWDSGQHHDQLDAVNATKKLILAAKIYGRREAARYAAEFATHGMIEVHSTYLLKGPPIEVAKSLDDYCTLLPYSQARGKPEADSHPEDSGLAWPEPHAGNICALECRYFEDAGQHTDEPQRYTSPLLTEGLEHLTLILGLAWGCGLRVFGHWHFVPPPAAAALPYRNLISERGAGNGIVALAAPGYGPAPWQRPLPVQELHDLVSKFSRLPEQVQLRLARAMRRVRSTTERVDEEDRTIDIGIALQTLFQRDDEPGDAATLVPSRAAWYYADSGPERRQTEDLLEAFFANHSVVVHGREPDQPRTNEQPQTASMLSATDGVLRASIKSLIAEGWPEDWEEATDPSALWRDPRRDENQIPSAKSDSLSWSVKELREIDQALEAVWQPIIEQAPSSPEPMHSTYADISPELVEQYQEQGTPYVVIHPARLYLAHPKWPGTAADSPDERTVYYCNRDVERHLRRWSDAAGRKGLVQLRVPNDHSDAYLLKNRANWPQPLYSSHETDSGVKPITEPTPIAEAPSESDQSATEGTPSKEPTAAEEDVTPPSQKWPESVVASLEGEWGRLWLAFRHDVNVVTDTLLHQLDAIHAKHRVERRHLRGIVDRSTNGPQTLKDAARTYDGSSRITGHPKLRAHPVVLGESLFRRTEPDGPMERLAFKCWFYEVWDLWEKRYRNMLRHAVGNRPGAIRPRQEVLGDLRDIRNDLVHIGIAGGRAARCKVLRWFKKGEPMQVRMRHVFDFLNQMGWLDEPKSIWRDDQGRASFWTLERTDDPQETPPDLISVRPEIHWDADDPSFRYGASIVFENGIFSRIPMGSEREETEAQQRETAKNWMKMTVNAAGELHVPGIATVSAELLYAHCLKGETQPGPGIYSPWVQFRESPDND